MTAAAVLVSALGIGTITVIFALAYGLLLRPLPYPFPDRLVALDEFSLRDSNEHDQIALANAMDVAARAHLLDDVGIYDTGNVTLLAPDGAEQVPAAVVTDGALRALGVQPLYGRLFTASETRPKGPRVAIISDELFRRRFGGDPSAIGKPLDTLNASYTIVGVMPERFHFPALAQAWFPLQDDPATTPRTDYFLSAVARLKPDASVEQADAEMQTLMHQIHAEHLPDNGWVGRVRPLRDVFSSNYRSGMFALIAAAVLLLAIACGNVANLLLLRASARRGEMAVRAALGASRRRLMRQMTTEGLLLGAAGGVVGIALAVVGTPAVIDLVPIDLPRWLDFSIDLRVLAFTIAVSLATSLAFALLPAFASTGTAMGDALKDAGRGAARARGQRRLRNAVVIAELAVSMMLLAGASLASRSFLAVRLQPLGYDTASVLSMDIGRSGRRYPAGAASRALLARIKDAVATLPGVQAVAFTSGVPLGDSHWGRLFTVEGHPHPLEQMTFVNHVVVTPDYFRTLGIPMRQGRAFTDADYGSTALVVSRGFAERNFPAGDALGKRIRFGPPKNQEPWYTIVGIVDDARHDVLKGDDRDTVYLPYGDDLVPGAMLVRTAVAPQPMVRSIVSRVQSIDRDLAVSQVRTLEQIVDRNAWRDRLVAVLFVGFAAIALFLAAAGLYAVLSYAVSLQTHEIGLRMALGASARGVRGTVVRQAMALALVGLGIGVPIAALLAWLWRGELYRISPADPVTFAVAPLTFLLVGAAAAYLPARRATRVDPIVALRHE